jgi:pimeloyl-ACP methyl ester carboxylesterase
MEELVCAEDPPTVGGGSSDSLSSGDASSGGEGGAGARGGRRGAGRVAAAVAQAVLAEGARLALLLLTPVLVLVLRRLVRSRAFWERGLASAWADGSRVTRRYVDAYRLPQLVRGWEGGMLRFLGARFSEKAGLWAALAHALRGDGHLSQAERLAAACAAGGVRVLLLHGTRDALVPAANSRRLARLLPGAELVEFEDCGHMPHEECAERFVREVAAFVEALDA